MSEFATQRSLCRLRVPIGLVPAPIREDRRAYPGPNPLDTANRLENSFFGSVLYLIYGIDGVVHYSIDSMYLVPYTMIHVIQSLMDLIHLLANNLADIASLCGDFAHARAYF